MTAPSSTQPNTQADELAITVTATYLASTITLRARLLAIVTALFAQSGRYGSSDAAAFVTAALPVVLAAQRSMASLTDAYLAHVITAQVGGLSAPVGVSPDVVSGAALRGGVDPVVVYRRPYVQVWTELARGTPFEDAVASGQRRLEAITATDVQLAKTHAAREVFRRDDRIVGYRRVLGANPKHCALCVIASTQRYHKEDLMPIHVNCDCGVEPIMGQRDPGRVIDSKTLTGLRETVERDLGPAYVDHVGGDSLAHYQNIIVTNEHSELGPVLGVRGQRFTGVSDIPQLTDAAP